MQKELDCLIQAGVAQLTRLLINSETKVSSGTSQAVEAEENRPVLFTKKTLYSRKKMMTPLSFIIQPCCNFLLKHLDDRNAIASGNPLSSHGRIADRLLSEGLLTPKMLEELKKEWQFQKDCEKESFEASNGIVDKSNPAKHSKNDPLNTRRLNRKRRT